MSDPLAMIEQTLLEALAPSTTERYRLTPAGRERLARALEAGLSTSSAPAVLDHVLRLVIALQNGMGSPKAATELLSMVRASPRAAMVAERARNRGRTVFRAQHGGPRAPHFEALTAPGLRLRDLIDPGSIRSPGTAASQWRACGKGACRIL